MNLLDSFSSHRREWLVALFAIVALGAINIMMLEKDRITVEAPDREPDQNLNSVVTTAHVPVNPNEIPKDIPGDIPLLAGAVYSRNTVTDVGSGGAAQSVVSFNTETALPKQYAQYEEYLKDNGWRIRNTHKDTRVISLYALKDDLEMNITSVLSDEKPGVSEVVISVLNK